MIFKLDFASRAKGISGVAVSPPDALGHLQPTIDPQLLIVNGDAFNILTVSKKPLATLAQSKYCSPH